jgi:serine/threonine protein kinase
MGLKTIGKGSYGVVVAATDSSYPNGRRVAIKKITPVAAHATDAKHVLREIRLMRFLGGHENIISLHDLILREEDDELYIVMELFDSDLHKVIQSPQPLTDAHNKHFIYQLFSGMNYMHDHRIIHRDLKPGNLLVSRDCKLRITDFGLARVRPTGKGEDPDQDIDQPMTEHVVTRWYRPPELMLCPDGLYTYAVDLWSAGCILAELLGRKPLFPGKNFVHQLSLIFDVIGVPPAHETSHIRNTQAKRFLATQVGKRKIPLNRVFPLASPDAIDMLEELLVFSPENRATAQEMLHHSYLHGVGNPSASVPVRPPSDINFDFETQDYSRHQLRDLIMEEIVAFHHHQTPARRRSSSSSVHSLSEEKQSGHPPRNDHAQDLKHVPRPEIPPPVTSASSSRRPSFGEAAPVLHAPEAAAERPASSHVAEHKELAPSPSARNTAAMERLESTSAKAMEILSPAHKLVNSESTETIPNATYPNNGKTGAPARAPPAATATAAPPASATVAAAAKAAKAAKATDAQNHHHAGPASEKQTPQAHKSGRPPRHSTSDSNAQNGTAASETRGAAGAAGASQSGVAGRRQRSRDVAPDRKAAAARASDTASLRGAQSSTSLSTVAEAKPSSLPRYLTATAASSSRRTSDDAARASEAPRARTNSHPQQQQQQAKQQQQKLHHAEHGDRPAAPAPAPAPAPALAPAPAPAPASAPAASAGLRKRHVTIPKSPQFSKMSWQKRGTEADNTRGHGAK